MKIRVIAVYLGRWPVWLPAFLQSCRYNPGVDWLIFTDCPLPPHHPANVRFEPATLSSLRELATSKLGFGVGLNRPYKMCDLRPAYGVVFADHLRGYDFWGHCDLDIIWGNIRSYLTDEVLDGHDIVAARKEKMCGHFSLYRNTATVNDLFRKNPRHREFLSKEEYVYYDEVGATKLVQTLVASGELRAYWPSYLFNGRLDPSSTAPPSRLGPHSGRWRWSEGRLFDCREEPTETMYLHFMTWKNSLRHCAFGLEDDPESFVISFSHIGLKQEDGPPTPRLRYYLDMLRVARTAHA